MMRKPRQKEKEDLDDVETAGDNLGCQNDDDEECGSGMIEIDGIPSQVQPKDEINNILLLDPLPTLPTGPSSKDWYGLPYMKRLKSGTSWHGYTTAQMLA